MLRKFWLAALLLLILVLAELFSFSHLDWSLSSYAIYGREPARHADFFFMGYHVFSRGVLKYMAHFYTGLHNFVVWPPFYYLTFGPLMKIFGFDGLNWFPLYFARLVLWWLYGLVLWALGKKVWGKAEGGFVALSLLWFNPVVLSMTFDVDTDFPALVAIALATLGLLYSNDFSKIGKSVLFGLLCGFALLTRTATAVFVIGLYIAALFFALRTRSKNRLKGFRNLVIAGLVTSLCAALFYVPMLSSFIEYSDNEFFGRDLTKWHEYVLYLTRHSVALFLPILVMFSFAAIVLILKRDKYLFAFTPLVLIAVLFFSSSTTHSPGETFTYVLPILLFLVILIIRAVFLISNNAIKTSISIAIILVGLISFVPFYATNLPEPYSRYSNIFNTPSANRLKDALFPYDKGEFFPTNASNDNFFSANLFLVQLLNTPYFKDSPTVIMFQEATGGVSGWSLGYIVYRYPIPTQWFCTYSDTHCLTDSVGHDTVFFIDNRDWCTRAKSFFLTLGHEVEKAWYISSPEPNPNKTGFCIVRFGDVAR